MTRRWLLILLSALLVLGAACGGGDDEGEDSDAASRAGAEGESPDGDETEGDTGGGLTIEAVDFAFKVPASVPAGETEITFENTGEEKHELFMVGLSEDAPPLEKLISMPQEEAQKFFAGPPTVIPPIDPGATETATADLQPGNYAMVCLVESKKEMKPHAFLGMVNEFTVE